MTQKRSFNGKFVATNDEYVQHLRDELLIAKNKTEFYKRKCERLERRLAIAYELINK